MTTTQRYDAIVIGAGQAGGPLSTALARAGRKTAIIERKHVGGTCINEGCTPTKTMIASARVAHLARRASDYGVDVGPITVDMRRVRQRKRDMVESFRSGSRSRIEETEGVDLLMGEARFIGPKTVAVQMADGERRDLEADWIFMNTGTRPRRPALDGLDDVPALNSTTIMELAEVPDHLLVVGGGYVGLEFGQMFRRFGSDVTIIQRGSQLLTREDPDVAEAVASILADEDTEILLHAEARRVKPTADGTFELSVQTPSGDRTMSGSHLLLAAGRVPNTDVLDLAATDVATDERGFIQVDDRLETTVPGIYALGDVKGGPAFTHISYDDFRIIRTNLLEGGSASTTDRLVPYTVFIDPQLGRIGLSETQARQEGRDIQVAKLPMSNVARALEVDETRGFMKAVVDAETDLILGFAMLGIEGGEIMAVVQMAMLGQVPCSMIRNGVFAHPTLAESLNNLLMTL